MTLTLKIYDNHPIRGLSYRPYLVQQSESLATLEGEIMLERLKGTNLDYEILDDAGVIVASTKIPAHALDLVNLARSRTTTQEQPK